MTWNALQTHKWHPSTMVFTRPNDGWTGLCIKLCWGQNAGGWTWRGTWEGRSWGGWGCRWDCQNRANEERKDRGWYRNSSERDLGRAGVNSHKWVVSVEERGIWTELTRKPEEVTKWQSDREKKWTKIKARTGKINFFCFIIHTRLKWTYSALLTTATWLHSGKTNPPLW